MTTAKKPQPPLDQQWRPHSTPGFEINGLGQLRTSGHKPGYVPTKPKLPVVIEDGEADDWGDCS